MRGLDVLAPPYDVLTEADRAAYASRSLHNIVHLDVPIAPDGYAEAHRLLDRWERDGSLVADPAPAFTAYRMSFTDELGRRRATTGVIGALELMRPGEGDVLPHERTTPKAKSDRLRLLQATAANLSAIWGLSLAHGLADLVAAAGGELMFDVTDEAGVRHEARRVDDPATVASIGRLVAAAPVVIADGHHRYETCLAYRSERRAASGDAPGDYDLTMAYVVELAEEHLHVEAIHRLISGLAPDVDLTAVLDRHFVTAAAGAVGPRTLAEMLERGALCLVSPGGSGTFLTPRPGVFADVADLDSARLDHALRDVSHDLSFQHGVDLVLESVRSGAAQAAVLLRPVPIATIEAFAHERRLMPPKSTFFAPKPKTGIVVRLLG